MEQPQFCTAYAHSDGHYGLQYYDDSLLQPSSAYDDPIAYTGESAGDHYPSSSSTAWASSSGATTPSIHHHHHHQQQQQLHFGGGRVDEHYSYQEMARAWWTWNRSALSWERPASPPTHQLHTPRRRQRRQRRRRRRCNPAPSTGRAPAASATSRRRRPTRH